jgi:hypothetical protein
MEQALLFIEENQAWIFLLLILTGLIYLRLSYKGYRELRAAMFDLERESAMAHLTRAVSMLVLVIAGVVTVFVVSTFLAPSLPASTLPTPLPTVSYLSSPEGQPEAAGGELIDSQSSIATVDSSGCLNPVATITTPEDGVTLSGVVTIEGTANIPSFAFYKLEYRVVRPNEDWRAIYADTSPKNDEVLGTWDTTLLRELGTYQFRLVVTDTAGNGPIPCVIQLTVVPGT